jgi:hypothetical protein
MEATLIAALATSVLTDMLMIVSLSDLVCPSGLLLMPARSMAAREEHPGQRIIQQAA